MTPLMAGAEYTAFFPQLPAQALLVDLYRTTTSHVKSVFTAPVGLVCLFSL